MEGPAHPRGWLVVTWARKLLMRSPRLLSWVAIMLNSAARSSDRPRVGSTRSRLSYTPAQPNARCASEPWQTHLARRFVVEVVLTWLRRNLGCKNVWLPSSVRPSASNVRVIATAVARSCLFLLVGDILIEY